MPSHRLTLLTAPPGYGKTTLATQFVRHSSFPVAWHTVGERERDIPVLVARSTVALETIAPGIQESVQVTNAAPGDLAALIADYLHASLGNQAIYILDDVHLLFGAPAAEAWLRSLVALVPAKCHLVLISRVLPDLPLLDLIAQRNLLTIGPEDLRFSAQEIRQLAVEVFGEELTPERFQELEGRLEGWPAGTALAFLPPPSTIERAILQGRAGPEGLFDALAEAMLDKQPADVREFLLLSATLSRLSPERCRDVLNLPNADDLLMEIQARNLFVRRVQGGLSYHHLFRDFLQRCLGHTDPARFAALHGQAARYFEARDEPDEAFDHFLAAGQPERAAAIADQMARDYYRAGRVEALLDWQAKLSRTTEQPVQLIYICAIVHMARYEFEAAQAHLDEIEAIYRVQGMGAELAEVTIQRASIELLKGDYGGAAERAKLLLSSQPISTVLRMRALNTLGYAQLYLGQIDTAVNSLGEALALYRVHSDAYGTSQVLQTLAEACFRLGRLADATAHLQEVVALQRSLRGTRALALALNNLGFYYHRTSQYDQALTTFQEALDILARYPDRRAESYLLWSLSGLRRDLGDYDEALKLYHRALECLGNGEPSARCSMMVALAMLKRWHDQWPEAEALSLEAGQLAEQHGLVVEACLAHANLWLAHAHLGEPGRAREHLISIVSTLRAKNARTELLQVLTISAMAALLDSRPSTARQHLSEALRLAESIGTAQTIAVEAIHMPVLQTLIDEPNLLSHDLGHLRTARARQSHLIRPAKASQRLPYSLRVLSLGQETLSRDGKGVPASDWRAVTARELFFYLLFVGPSRRETICAELWPDSNTEQVRSNFHTTLYHARQALGADTLTFEEGLYRISVAVDVWCDAYQLEHLIVQARLLAPRDARAEDLWRKAIELYQGEFLPTLDANWIVTYRERIRELYVEGLVGLGQSVRSRHDLSAALDIFRRASAVDPYREDIHQAILTCYAEKGQHQKVRAHLRQLERLLRKDLDSEPSLETRALAAALLQ